MPDDRPPHDLSTYAELDKPADGDIVLKPFAQFLQEARKGGLHTELSERLPELARIVLETGKKGSITLKLTLTPMSDGQMVAVADDVTLKAPRANVPATYYYADKHGGLHRDPPQQLSIPLREVPGGRDDEPLREVPEIRERGTT